MRLLALLLPPLVLELVASVGADEALPMSCIATFSPLCLPHPHNGLLKQVSVEAAPDCCAACAGLAKCASWELRGKSRCILRSAAPGVGAAVPGTTCTSNALRAPSPPPAPPPLPFVPTNNGNAFGVWTKYGSVGDPTPLTACPILSGHLIKVQWGEIEPSDGAFNFSILDARMANATDQGLSVALMVWVASPGGTAAPWLIEDKLVPAVRVVGSGSHPTVSYAWYFSDVSAKNGLHSLPAAAVACCVLLPPLLLRPALTVRARAGVPAAPRTHDQCACGPPEGAAGRKEALDQRLPACTGKHRRFHPVAWNASGGV
eukprot:SAG31_NODE_373_length_16597_cov_21.519518_9_plen_317_part_00